MASHPCAAQEVDDVSPLRSLDGLALDIRFAARSLVHRRGFAAAATLTPALGIGASTSIFSVVYGVLLRQLPYAEAERLVLIQTRDRTTAKLFASGL
jgi:putative ABC transport system permease protein